MLDVTNNSFYLYQKINLEQIYENYSIILNKNNCNYISILDDNFQIKRSYIYLQNLLLTPSKLTKMIFTNNYNLFNIYIKRQNPRIFKSFEQYSNFVMQKANYIKIINILPYKMFNMMQLESNSQLVNIQKINLWWNQNKRSFKYLPFQSLKIYNFFNFTLYLLSRNSLNCAQNRLRIHFQDRLVNQGLLLDLDDNRCKINPEHINYHALSSKQERWKYIKAHQGKLIYKIDYTSSYMNLLAYVLQIKIDCQDIYLYLGRQLNLNLQRQKLKQHIFKILFSNQIKNYMHIQFFKKCYLFSLYLKQQYTKNGFIHSLISQKQIRLENNIINRSKLFNAFIMSLQTQLYLGILYNVLQFEKEKIKPVIFIFDAIIFQIDVQWCLKNMNTIQDVLSLNGLLKMSHSIGYNLNHLEQI